MKNFILSVVFTVMSLHSATAFSTSMSGHEGNGGDAVEAFFIKTGSELLKKLSRTPEGQYFLKQLPVSLQELNETLDHSRITVTDDILFDNTGAKVDAKAENGIIQLRRENWLKHMASKTPPDMLVFHEMLRSVGINDDGYRYSMQVGLISDLTDPREAFNLSRYLTPEAVQMHVSGESDLVPLTTFAVVNNLEAKVTISATNLKNANSIRKNQDKTYTLSIPLNNFGVTKLQVYRVDYEYIGYMKVGTVLRSRREVRFQSSAGPIRTEQSFATKAGQTKVITDLIHLESPYKESLNIRVANHIVSGPNDKVSHMVLNRVIVHFNILRL